MTSRVSAALDFRRLCVQIRRERYHERNPDRVAHHSMFNTLCARYRVAFVWRFIEERKLKVQLHPTASTTRRKRTKGRRESDATFELLFENNPLPLWVYDLETLRFLDINAVACTKYGY